MSTSCRTIYALADPRTNEWRYIGASVNPHRRIAQHRFETYPVGYWIRQLSEEGMEPVVVTVQGPTTDWAEAEREWIAEAAASGYRLLNIGHNPALDRRPPGMDEAWTPELLTALGLL